MLPCIQHWFQCKRGTYFYIFHNGTVEYGYLPYSPGFSLVIVNPSGRNGRLVVEFYGYANDLITDRMHLEISRNQSQYWFEYWEEQFKVMWDAARKLEETT